jgi:putative acetyltransferase
VGEAAVRDARADEAAALAAIQAEASLAGLAHIFPPELYPYPHDEVRERWRAVVADDAYRVLVADDGGRAVGVAAVRPGWLDGLYVLPSHWGTGVAGALHDRALAAHGAGTCSLWVLEDNTRARRFYERRGWRENGTTRVVPFPPHPLDVGYSRCGPPADGSRGAVATADS